MKTHLVKIGQRISFKSLRSLMKHYSGKWLNMEGKTLLQLKLWYKAHIWRGSKGMLLWLLPIMLPIQVAYLDYVLVSASYLALNWSSGSVAVAGYSRKMFLAVAMFPPNPKESKRKLLQLATLFNSNTRCFNLLMFNACCNCTENIP